MPRALTDKTVQNLRPKKAPYMRFDPTEKGLAIKVTPGGKKLFVMWRYYGGPSFQSARTIGTYPAMSLAEARKKGEQWNIWLEQGRDQLEVERELEEAKVREKAKAASNTFGALAEEYFKSQMKGRRKAKSDERDIRKELVLAWRD